MDAPSRDELETKWPYWWRPHSREHALYEARTGGGVRFLIGVLTLAAPLVLLWPSDGGVWVAVLSVVLAITGSLEAVAAIRYSTYCYWWAGINPWWVRTDWLLPVRRLALAAGTTVRAIDAFGKTWGGLISILSLLLAVVAIALR